MESPYIGTNAIRRSYTQRNGEWRNFDGVCHHYDRITCNFNADPKFRVIISYIVAIYSMKNISNGKMAFKKNISQSSANGRWFVTDPLPELAIGVSLNLVFLEVNHISFLHSHHVPIEFGVSLFPYENSLLYFAKYQFILSAKNLDVVQIRKNCYFPLMFRYCREDIMINYLKIVILFAISQILSSLFSYHFHRWFCVYFPLRDLKLILVTEKRGVYPRIPNE